MKKILLSTALFSLILSPPAKAQTNFTTNAANFQDPRVMFINPSATALRTGGVFVSGFQRPHLSLAGESLGDFYSGVSFPLLKSGVFSIDARWFQSTIFNTIQGGLGYALPFGIGGKKIAFGGRLGLIGNAYDRGKFDLREQNDPLLAGGASVHALDLGVGVTANILKDLYLGIGANHLNSPDLSLGGGQAGVPKRTNISAIYMHSVLRPQIGFEREAGQSYFNFGLESWLLNQRAILRGHFQSEKMTLGAAYILKNWRFDFEYEYPTTSLNEITNGSLNVTLSYDFGKARLPEIENDDFDLTILPLDSAAAKSVIPGKSMRFKIALKPAGHLPEPVSLRMEDPPEGISVTIIPPTLTPGDSGAIDIDIGKSVPPDLYDLKLTGKTRTTERHASIPVQVRGAILSPEIVGKPDKLAITEIKTISEERPLLNFVFFQENDVQIPANRYVLLNPDNTELPKWETFTRLPTISGQYSHSLNFFGRRLLDNPAYKIVLIGCNTNIDAEQGNLTLSRRRAESVRNYLVSVWGVAENRIEVRARNLPEAPSPLSDARGREENRRVEILPKPGSEEILAAFNSTVVETAFSAPNSLFLTRGSVAEAGAKSWRLSVARSNRAVVREFAGSGALPDSVFWDWRDGRGVKIDFQDSLIYTFSVIDSLDQRNGVSGPAIAVRYIRRDTVSTPEITRSRLLFFAFDDFRVNLQSPHLRKELEKIEARFRQNPTARIEVKGFTDTLGNLSYNVGLSNRRAQAVKEELVRRGIPAGRISSAGFGPDIPIMSNAFPEGRMMNRRVEIDVILVRSSKGR